MLNENGGLYNRAHSVGFVVCDDDGMDLVGLIECLAVRFARDILLRALTH